LFCELFADYVCARNQQIEPRAVVIAHIRSDCIVNIVTSKSFQRYVHVNLKLSDPGNCFLSHCQHPQHVQCFRRIHLQELREEIFSGVCALENEPVITEKVLDRFS
jgi:hypothetical protein